MEDCARVLAELFSSLNITEAIVMGTSWGGIVAAEFALRYPDLVSGVVLMNTPFAMPERPSLNNRLIVAMTRFIPNWRVFKQGVARSFFAPTTWNSKPQVIESFLSQPRTFQNPGLYTVVKAVLIERSSLIPQLPQLKKPALVIAGAEDRLYPVTEIQEAAARIPKREFHVVANSAHISAAE
jgi:3-oxoadipate enol-lactonase